MLRNNPCTGWVNIPRNRWVSLLRNGWVSIVRNSHIPKLHDAVWSLLRHNPREIENILEKNNNAAALESDIQQLEEAKSSAIEIIEKIERQEKQLLDLLLDEKIDRILYNKRYISLTEEKEKQKEELSECLKELDIKNTQKEKQRQVGHQLRGIKDNKRILKRVINNVIVKIIIYPILKHNLDQRIKTNKQDNFVYIEVYTYVSDTTPLSFIISQRSDLMIIPNQKEYDKETKNLVIGKGIVGEEEEEEVLITRELFHLNSLD